MLLKTIFIYILLSLGVFVHAAVQPESTCFNPKLKQYKDVAEFVREATSKFDKNDSTGQGDPKDAAQAFVCVSAMFKWMRTFGTKAYTMVATNETGKPIKIFGRNVVHGGISRGNIYNGKGYFFWQEGNICYMTRFENNSSVVFSENISIRPNQQLFGGAKRSGYYQRPCQVVQVDQTLCNGQSISYEEEAYVMGKWLAKMKPCTATYA